MFISTPRFSTYKMRAVKRATPVQAVVAGAIFFFLGSGLTLFLGIPTVKNAAESKNWPSIDGIITVSELTKKHKSDGGITYGADVAYNYMLVDVMYTGNAISFGQYSSSNPAHAQEIINRYPVGKKVAVFYNPTNPSKSTLEPGMNLGSFVAAAIGIIFAVAGLLIFLSNIRKIGRPTNRPPEIVSKVTSF